MSSLLEDLPTGVGPHQDYRLEAVLGEAVDVGAQAVGEVEPSVAELVRRAARASVLHALKALGLDTGGVTVRGDHAPVIERVP